MAVVGGLLRWTVSHLASCRARRRRGYGERREKGGAARRVSESAEFNVGLTEKSGTSSRWRDMGP